MRFIYISWLNHNSLVVCSKIKPQQLTCMLGCLVVRGSTQQRYCLLTPPPPTKIIFVQILTVLTIYKHGRPWNLFQMGPNFVGMYPSKGAKTQTSLKLTYFPDKEPPKYTIQGGGGEPSRSMGVVNSRVVLTNFYITFDNGSAGINT